MAKRIVDLKIGERLFGGSGPAAKASAIVARHDGLGVLLDGYVYL
jgi:hypothetical protein